MLPRRYNSCKRTIAQIKRRSLVFEAVQGILALEHLSTTQQPSYRKRHCVRGPIYTERNGKCFFLPYRSCRRPFKRKRDAAKSMDAGKWVRCCNCEKHSCVSIYRLLSISRNTLVETRLYVAATLPTCASVGHHRCLGELRPELLELLSPSTDFAYPVCRLWFAFLGSPWFAS